MRSNNSTTEPMVDPRHQPLVEADSVARAIDYNRQARAAFLEATFLIDIAGFDRSFLDFYGQDRAIVLVLSDAAAKRGLSLIQPRDVQ
jgi:hypothetical protein